MSTDVSNTFAWDGPAVGLLDLDAFFASVEQLDHPSWRGKPVIVGGPASKRGVVSTASYEARKFGVHSAMASATAERLCPDAIWTHGNFARYREVSARVMALIVDETPLVEQVSIDEAFFDVTPGRWSNENPIWICRRLQSRVSELGVTCSIGIGVNKTVAKIASEREKPRGLTVVYLGTEAGFLAPLPVGAMSGIGKASQARLDQLGIHTLGELARADEKLLAQNFGVMGPRMKVRAAGLERSSVAPIDAPEDVKSVSNERTFEHDLLDEAEIKAAIKHIADMVGTRLRKKGLAGRTVTLKIKYDARTSRSAQCQLRERTSDERVFGEVAVGLLDEVWRPGQPVRLLGVGVSGFEERAEQAALFSTDDASGAAPGTKGGRDLSALGRVTDQLKARFGESAIAYGHDLRFKGERSE